jgi:hypothetical protein
MSIRQQSLIHCRPSVSNRKSPGGFVLVFVIVAILIIGIEMFVLGAMANTLQYQSHRVYLEACQRNLLGSGLAWARQNIQESSGGIRDHTIELDVSEMDVPGSTLSVTVGAGSEVQIQTSCHRGRQTLNHSGTYEIERHDQQETAPGTRQSPAGD